MTDIAAEEIRRRAFQDEALRRIARKSKVSSTTQTRDDDVNEALRVVAESIVDQFCKKAIIIMDYQGNNTLTPKVFDLICHHVGLKADHYAAPDREDGKFPPSKKFKHTTSERALGRRDTPARARGKKAKKEIAHEGKNEQCVYGEFAPFVRYVRTKMARYRPVGRPEIRCVPAVLSWLQYLVEDILATILCVTGDILKATCPKATTGVPKDNKPRATVRKGDIVAAVDVLKRCMPVLRNAKPEEAIGRDRRRRGDSGDAGGGGAGGVGDGGGGADGGFRRRGRGRSAESNYSAASCCIGHGGKAKRVGGATSRPVPGGGGSRSGSGGRGMASGDSTPRSIAAGRSEKRRRFTTVVEDSFGSQFKDKDKDFT